MQLRKILLAASLFALPATLHAQPITGVYVGAGVGVNQLLDMDVKGVPGAKVTSDVGLAALGSVGYGFGNGLRIELEGNYRNQHARSKPAGASGTAESYGAMANVLYDFDMGGVSPYVGAGVGVQWMHLQGGGTSDPAAAAQGIVGVAIPVGMPGLAVTAEARVLGWFDDARFNGGKLEHPINVSGLVGLRYAFGVAPAPVEAPAPVPAPKAEEARTFLVFFDWDKSDLTARARQIIADAAGASQRLAVTRIEVSGHADHTGTAQYNQALSMRRAQTVAAELVRLGVQQQAISISAYGFSRPLVPTAAGVREPQNRRVEIVLK
jgi:outer membrane protein OmpA-like peptidoglycan-associated protein